MQAAQPYIFNLCPTLTMVRAGQGGFWVSCRGRTFTVGELEKLMGVKGMTRPHNCNDRQWTRMLGNGIAVPVLEMILIQLLPYAKLIQPKKKVLNIDY